MAKKEARLSTEPYKGVRDFYPEDQFLEHYLFEHWERACELYGYEEYSASILEPSELFRGKTSEEIVNEQTYSFTDRGEREVTLRPEMTPTLARMVAGRLRDMALPARLYSIPNCFRYERPQRGRIREFWQLNADIIGHQGIESDAEIIALAYAVMRNLGADDRDFEIRVSDRRLLEAAYDTCGVPSEARADITRLLDRKAKTDNFEEALAALVGKDLSGALSEHLSRTTSSAYLEELRSALELYGVRNMAVDTEITRGFDYYTGMVFEIFDTNEENRRSIAGGGRYDNLLSLFGGTSVPAVGFAMGDIVARDFLETHNLLPAYAPATELMVCVLEPSAYGHAIKIAQDLRREDIAVAVNFSGRKAADMIRAADKQRVPFMLFIGGKERDSGRYTLKNLETGAEITLPADRIAEHLFSSLG